MSATQRKDLTRRYVKKRKLSHSPFLPNVGPMLQTRQKTEIPNTRGNMLQFQRFYGLPRTGQMDARTSEKMRQQRISPGRPRSIGRYPDAPIPRRKRIYGRVRATQRYS